MFSIIILHFHHMTIHTEHPISLMIKHLFFSVIFVAKIHTEHFIARDSPSTIGAACLDICITHIP